MGAYPTFTALASSNLLGCSYDAPSEVLYVEFKGGGRYKYVGVPEDVYQGLIEAGSPGSYFSSNIKDMYPHTQY